MNQKSGQNSLGLDNCFEDEANPIDLFEKWFEVAEKSEINDPNALSLATSINGVPSVRMVLLKGLSDKGFVFYTNFNSKKGNDLKNNPSGINVFSLEKFKKTNKNIWKSKCCIINEEANKYFNSRAYGSRIGAWASSQSQVMKNRNEFFK